MAQPSNLNRKYTWDEYWEIVGNATDGLKRWYWDGQILIPSEMTPNNMSGGGIKHSTIGGNLSYLLGSFARSSKTCRSHNADLLVLSKKSGRSMFPDASISCGEIELEKHRGIDALLNPKVVFEVLSPSTEVNDRGRKFEAYQTINSVEEIVLIASETRRVEVFRRQNDQWVFVVFTENSSEVVLNAVELTLSMDELYRDVTFDEAVLTSELL
jgi:Uma2 family endonuclease